MPAKFVTFGVVWSCLITLGFGQSPRGILLRGVVILNEEGGTPAVGVTVSADGANDTATVAGGKFQLQFPYKKVGDPIEVRVSRPGYVVVNWIQQKLNLPSSLNSEELTLIICKEREREAWALNFYRLKGGEVVDATYRERLRELEETNRNGATEIASLKQERDHAQAAAVKAATGFARVKPGDATDLYAQAMALFVQGKVAEALKVLDEKRLEVKLAAAQQEEQLAKDEKASAIQGILLRAELLTGQYEFAEAERIYASLAERFPDNFEIQYAYGNFSLDARNFAVARTCLENALVIARREHDEARTANTLNDLGVLEKNQDQTDKAYAYLEESLKIRNKLVTDAPDTFRPDVAESLNNLGNLDLIQNHLDEAHAHLEEALEIRRKLAEKNPDLYLPDFAMALGNLGNQESDQNRLAEARVHLEKSLKFYRELAEKNPNRYLPDLAKALNNLGTIDLMERRLSDARQDFEKELQDSRQLAKKNRDIYLPFEELALNNLGLLDREENHPDQARAHLEEALDISRELAEKNPDQYLPDLASSLNNLGNLYRREHRLAEAREYLEKAVEICRELAEKNPDRYLPELADTLNNLGNIYFREERRSDARQEYEEALKDYRQLADKDPETYRSMAAGVLHNLGELDRKQNRID